MWILEYLTHCPAYFTMAHWGMLLSENTKVPMRSDVSPTLVFCSIISQVLACSLKQKFSFQDLTLHSLVWTILTFETISFILLCRLKWHIGAWQIKFYVSSQPSLRRAHATEKKFSNRNLNSSYITQCMCVTHTWLSAHSLSRVQLLDPHAL